MTSLCLAARALRAGLCLTLGLVGLAQAQQSWPTRPVRIIVPYTVGGASDITARLLADKLSERLGQPFSVDNRAGASGTIGTEAVAKANDGHTLLMVASSHVVNGALFPKLGYDPIKSFMPITHTANVHLVMVAPSSLGAQTVSEWVALAKAKPGSMSYASSGNGSNPQFFAEMFKQAAGLDLIHVPYKGSTAAHTDLIAGRTHLMFDAMAAVAPHVKSGRLRLLAIASPARSALLPGVPTLAEAGVPGYGATSWGALLAPAGTPASVIALLHKESVSILQSAEVKEKLALLGAEVVASTPEQLGELMRKEEVRYTKMVRELQITPD